MSEKITGYVEQTPEQIDCINNFKAIEIEVVQLIDNLMTGLTYVGQTEPLAVDKRWLSIAKTNLQQGFMAAVRSVARPKGD